MDSMLEKKLLIKPDKSVVVFQAPTDFKIKTTVNLKKPADVTIVFVRSKADIGKLSSQAIKRVKEDGALWFAYPKISSGIKTDISRDAGWDVLRKEKYEPVTQIAIDEMWSALRFKPIDKIPKMIRQMPMGAKKPKDLKERVLDVPVELTQLLNKNTKVKNFFDTLSFTNRKEYAVWISSAKRPETKEKRLTDTVAKLLARKKNPSEK
jgi:Bacteriocin-protection, YdeI or OmpD-Associated